MKTPGFAKNIIAKSAEKRKRLSEKKVEKESLYIGDPSLQWGGGGWRRHRANLVYGVKGAGKSTLAMIGAGKEQQMTGGWVVIFDSEYAYSDPHAVDESGNPTAPAMRMRERLAKAGVNWEQTVICQGNNINTLFEFIGDIEKELQKDPSYVSAIIVDSWNGIQAEQANKKITAGKVAEAGNSFGGNAKTIGPMVQTLLRIAAEHGVTNFWVQHCMANQEQYGPRWLLLGGERLKFLCDTILFLESLQNKEAHLLEGDVASESHADAVGGRVGKEIAFRWDKSRFVVEGRSGSFYMNFNTCQFALPEKSLFNLAEKLGVIGKPVAAKMNDKGDLVVLKDGQPILEEKKTGYAFPSGDPSAITWKSAPSAIESIGVDKELFSTIWQACQKSSNMAAIEGHAFAEVGMTKEDGSLV